MTNLISEQRSRLQSLTQEYDNFLGDGVSTAELSVDEQTILTRISQKLEEIKTHIDSAGASPEQNDGSGAADDGAQKRKAGRLDRIREMHSSISGLMTSLKSAR